MKKISSIALWWHCLIHLHQEVNVTKGVKILGIYVPLICEERYCFTCGFGRQKAGVK